MRKKCNNATPTLQTRASDDSVKPYAGRKETPFKTFTATNTQAPFTHYDFAKTKRGKNMHRNHTTPK